MHLSAAIFDDEPLARLRLRRLLEELEINVIDEGENGQQAIETTLKNTPDLLFLDIQMPRLDGLSAAKSINNSMHHPPAIIFCTAFDEHAIEAFKANATAYLLKPFDLLELKSAIDRSYSLNRVQASELSPRNTQAQYIPISSSSGIEKINTNHIVLFHAQEKHVYLTMISGRKIFVDTPLKEIEEKYSDIFIRTSRSTIVNKNQILTLNTHESGYTIELNYKNKTLPVSRRKLSLVKAVIMSTEKNNSFTIKDN